MTKIFLITLSLFFLQGLHSYPLFKPFDGKEELKQVDIDFSNLSKEKGTAIAFTEYVAEDGVLLRPFSYPIIGKDKVSELMNQDDNSGTTATLTWTPLYADIAASGELGYTYGTWQMHIIKSDKTEERRVGTYVSIWKKDKAGKWKWVLDTGNPGLEPRK